MKNIAYKDAKAEQMLRTIYVYEVIMDSDNQAIEKLKYFYKKADGKWSNSCIISAEDLGKEIYDDKTIAWSGKLDDENHQFSDVSKVIPVIQNKVFSVKSISDDSESNNLEKLPGYKKKQ